MSPSSPVLAVAFPSVPPASLLLLPQHQEVVPVNLLLPHHLPRHLPHVAHHLSIKCRLLHPLYLLVHHQLKEPHLSGIKTSVIS